MGTNRPYFLTAFHCADSDNNGVLSNTEKMITESWSFGFNYKKTTCNGNVLTIEKRYNSAYFRSAGVSTDFLLLELKETIKDPNIRFLG
jgi:hypothetical protein